MAANAWILIQDANLTVPTLRGHSESSALRRAGCCQRGTVPTPHPLWGFVCMALKGKLPQYSRNKGQTPTVQINPCRTDKCLDSLLDCKQLMLLSLNVPMVEPLAAFR